jgi:DNA-damage-inducible protein J
MTTLNVRIDEKLKKKAQKIADQLGMDLSTVIKVFLVQLVMEEGIPFEIRTENGFTLKEELKMRKEAKDALRSGKRFSSAKALLDDIMN